MPKAVIDGLSSDLVQSSIIRLLKQLETVSLEGFEAQRHLRARPRARIFQYNAACAPHQ